MKAKESYFNLRSFTSFSLVISTLIMSWSGFILYIAPPGRIANWGAWKLMLFTKSEWQALHTIFSYLFFILAIVHLFFVNWKTFLTYIKSKIKSGLNKKWELIGSLILSGFIFAGTIQSWTPFGPVMTFGEKVKGNWEKSYSGAPVAHTEENSMTKIAASFKVAPDEIVATLAANNIRVRNTDLTLRTVASENNTVPSIIYDILTLKYGNQPNGASTEPPSGTGKLTIKTVAEKSGKDLSSILSILKEKGVEANRETTLREIAEKLGTNPRDLYSMLTNN